VASSKLEHRYPWLVPWLLVSPALYEWLNGHDVNWAGMPKLGDVAPGLSGWQFAFVLGIEK
jgi:hypothetical protein